MLRITKVNGSFADKEKLEQINTGAFPPVERMDVDRLLELSTKDCFELLAVYDGDALVGFALLGVSEHCVYIFLLAVDEAQRSKGYGSRILAELGKRYPGRQIVLDLEGLDPGADNHAQRVARRNFYLRNGFQETGYFMDYFGIKFEVLCSDRVLEKDCFVRLLDRINEEGFCLKIYQPA